MNPQESLLSSFVSSHTSYDVGIGKVKSTEKLSEHTMDVFQLNLVVVNTATFAFSLCSIFSQSLAKQLQPSV